MKEQTISSFYLEVLQENHPAIKAHSKTGLLKTRGLSCFSLKIAKFIPTKPIQTIIYVDYSTKREIDSYTYLLDWEPSWENHFESIKRISDDVNIIVARTNGKNVGLLVYYPTLKWIMILAVDPEYRRKGVATALLEFLLDNIPIYQRELKILNIQEKNSPMLKFLKDSGFELVTSQFEMNFQLQ